MNDFWVKTEEIWNESNFIAILLISLAALALIWTIVVPQSPGVSIGLLALAAGIMSIRPQMHPAEKTAWVAILGVLAVLEVMAIKNGEEASRQERDRQNRKFSNIVETLKTSIAESRDQYATTIGHVDSVLNTTQEVSALSKKNLENITGGKSYAYLVPQPVEKASGYSMNAFNDGKQLLNGVTIRISRVHGVRPGAESYWLDSGAAHAIVINSLAPHSHALLPDYWIAPLENGTLTNHFLAIISAQNGDVLEDIFFRPALQGKAFAYKFSVKRQVNGKYRTLKIVDWTEPKPL